MATKRQLVIRTALVCGGAFTLAALCFALDDATTKAVETTANGAASTRTATQAVEGLNDVRIASTSADINVELSDDQSLHTALVATSDAPLPDDVRLESAVDGQTLRITVVEGKDRNFSFFQLMKKNARPSLLVRMPKGFKPTLDIHSVSGDVRLPELALTAAKVSTVSGDLDLTCLHGATFAVESVSGDIDVRDCIEGDSVVLKTTSGDVAVAGIKGRVDVTSVSGDVNVEGVGTGTVRTTSGNIDLRLTPTAGELRGNSISGDVTVVLPREANPALALTSLSGEIHANGRHLEHGSLEMPGTDEKTRLTIGTTSGDINVSTF